MPIDLNKIETFQDAIVTVMGLGRLKQGSGMGAAKWLLRHGAQLVVTDLKTEEDLQESVDELMKWYSAYRKESPDREIYSPVFVLGEHHADDFTNTELVVQNPGVPRESEFVKLAEESGVSIESDQSLFIRYCPFPFISITGTRGKSTTTALLGEMFKTQSDKTVIAGNIGRSPLEDLDWLLKESAAVPIVLELSSWLLESLENIDKGPRIAILTNAYKDHLDRYASFEDYVSAKERIFDHQKPEDFAILNADLEVTAEIGTRVAAKPLWFSLKQLPEGKEGVYFDNGKLVRNIGGLRVEFCNTSEMALSGDHNIQNALAASLAAHVGGLSDEAIVKVLKEFKGLPHRQEIINEANGITFVNDTTATSPEGAVAALKRFGVDEKEIVLIAGGTAKGFDYQEMADEAARVCKKIILISHPDYNANDQLAKAIGSRVPIELAETMEEATQKAFKSATSGDFVLLSPGAKSFGPFKNEFDRGDHFVREVRKIAG